MCAHVARQTASYRLIVVKYTDELLVGDLSRAFLVDSVKHGVQFHLTGWQLCISTISRHSSVSTLESQHDKISKLLQLKLTLLFFHLLQMCCRTRSQGV